MVEKPSQHTSQTAPKDGNVFFQEFLARYPFKTLPFGQGVLTVEDILTLLDYSLTSADNLAQGLNQWSDYLSLLLSENAFTVSRQSDYWVFHLPEQVQPPSWLPYLLLHLKSQLKHFGLSINDSYLQLNERLKHNKDHNPLLSQLNVSFQHPAVTLKISTSVLDFTSVLPPKTMASTVVQVLELLRSNRHSISLVESVRQMVERHLPKISSITQISQALGLSPRTLQRKLASDNIRFNALVKEVRQAKALSLLSGSALSIQAVGYRIGFSEQSSFNHAFKKWQGITPRQYRLVMQSQSAQMDRQDTPVSLFFVENHMQFDTALQRRGYQVWIKLKNLQRDKWVTVQFEYADGIWRDFRATYQRFLSEDIELWSTPNLIPANDLNFKIKYKVAGQTYLDDNQGRGYRVPVNSAYFKGPDPLVVTAAYVVKVAENKWLLRLTWLTEDTRDLSCRVIVGQPKRHEQMVNQADSVFENGAAWSFCQTFTDRPSLVNIALIKKSRVLTQQVDIPLTDG